jgi:hypothetical protein
MFASLTLNSSTLTEDVGVGVAGAELKNVVLKTGFADPGAQVLGHLWLTGRLVWLSTRWWGIRRS